jgi:hypothetical protein
MSSVTLEVAVTVKQRTRSASTSLTNLTTLKGVRPECMSPFRNSMGFVDRNHWDSRVADHFKEAFVVQALWS